MLPCRLPRLQHPSPRSRTPGLPLRRPLLPLLRLSGLQLLRRLPRLFRPSHLRRLPLFRRRPRRRGRRRGVRRKIPDSPARRLLPRSREAAGPGSAWRAWATRWGGGRCPRSWSSGRTGRVPTVGRTPEGRPAHVLRVRCPRESGPEPRTATTPGEVQRPHPRFPSRKRPRRGRPLRGARAVRGTRGPAASRWELSYRWEPGWLPRALRVRAAREETAAVLMSSLPAGCPSPP